MKRIKPLFANVKKLFLILVLVTQAAHGQQSVTHERFVTSLTTAISSKSAGELNTWLADDFSILGQKGEMASTVLAMLITQLDDTVLSYKELQKETIPEGIFLKYDFEYEKRGHRDVEITFNQDGLVKELKLVDGKVKIMDQSNKPKVRNPSGQTVLTIPVNVKENLIFTEVLVNDELQQFIIDTGSPRTILNSAYHQTTSSISSSKGIGGQSISNMDIISLNSLELHGLVLENENVITADLTHLESALNTPVHGIIGTDMLEAFDIIFDYANNNITLVDPDHFETYSNRELKNDDFLKVPFVDQHGHLPVVKLTVGTHEFNVVLDSGASTNALSTAHQERLSSHLSTLGSTDLRGISKTAIQKATGILDQVTLGGKNMTQVKTVFSELSHLDKPGAIKIDGIIGYSVLSGQKTILSYNRKELLLEK